LFSGWGHGSNESVFRHYWSSDRNDNAIPENDEIVRKAFFSSDYCPTVVERDDAHPSFVFQSSCSNGYPENTTNLGYSLLKKGAIATVSAARASKYTPSIYTTGVWNPDGYPDITEIGYEYVKALVNGSTAGEALYSVPSVLSQSHAAGWLNFMALNIYGDPSIGLYTGKKQQPVGKTIYVDDDKQDYLDADYEIIQDAIHHASPGDTIVVYPGTYEEQVDVNRKLTLKGIDHPVVDGLGSSGHTITMSAGGCVLDGFEVKNSAEDCAGIYVRSEDNVIKNNIVNSPGDSYGIYLDHSINNTIIDNTANLNKGVIYSSGIYLDYSNKNRITNNTASNNHGYGISLRDSNNNNLSNNIANSKSEKGLNLEYSSSHTITKNKASNNYYGIQLSHSDDNNIYLNNFINNDGGNVLSYASNIWSSGEKMTYVYKGATHESYMGNYWDDYIGSIKME